VNAGSGELAAGVQQERRINDLEALTLEQQHEKLKLVVAALWQVLREHTGLTDAELRRAIIAVDGRDGVVDNRVARGKERKQCPSCQRTIIKSSIRCVYCGEVNPETDGFHGT
jgi:hypothetical protein